MSDESTPASQTGPNVDSTAPSLDGHVFLYEQPELLSAQHHGQLGIASQASRYAFTSGVRLVPLVYSEIASAQKYYPVVFTEPKNPVPVAVLGVFENRNLFVDEAGEWTPDCYIPSYFRRYPFALARRDDEQFSMVIDRAATIITETPDLPFFDGNEPSETTKRMLEFCRQFDAANKQTTEFCKRLQELELLVDQQATHQPPGATEPALVANYQAVDTNKLQELPSETLEDLHRAGFLATIYAHSFSLENWNRLLERHATLSQE